MTTPDLLTSVGFNKRKIGAGDKELGYAIEKDRLGKLVGGVVGCVVLLSMLLVWSRFEIKFERRSSHHKLRVEEHHAASKLAKVEMELWSHFHEDIHESHEARSLLRSLNASYEDLRVKLQGIVSSAQRDLQLPPEKAAALADLVLRTAAEHKRDNLHHAKGLVDHLVASGKKSTQLEKHLDQEFDKEMETEKELMAADESEGEDERGYGAYPSGEEQEEELKPMVESFWKTFEGWQKEFGAANGTLVEGSPIHQQLADLQKKLQSEEMPSDEELEASLRQMNLTDFGLKYVADSSAFSRTPGDFLENALAVPKLPWHELSVLEHDFRTKAKDVYTVLTSLHGLAEEGRIPSMWIEQGVYDEQDEEARLWEGGAGPEG